MIQQTKLKAVGSAATKMDSMMWQRARRNRRMDALKIDKTPERCGANLLATETNEKAARQLDGLFFQGRIVLTEVQKDHQNFLAKSYWAAKGSVKKFLQNKCLCFQ